jgi:hypothetical protein
MAHVVIMIRLTLPDGTRTQLEASEITDVEPIAGGSLVHRAVGDPMKVMQDARTIQTRVNAELDSAVAEVEEAPITAAQIAPTIAVAEPELAIEPAPVAVVEPVARMHRLKRLMQGRVSGMAMTIGQMKRV